MKYFYLLLFFLLVLIQQGYSQEFETVRKTHQLIESRDIHLNGGMRSQFGGKSRTYIQIDLPKNTVKWMYSFTTAKGQNGTKGLNLLAQLSTLILDPTTLSANVLSEIEVPDGVASIDVYLCDRSNIDLFLKKHAYSYAMKGTVENTSSAAVEVDDIISGTVFLGLKNPSSMNGLNISIEVVAITEIKITIPKSEEQEKAELYGSLAWSHFEKRDFTKCIVYCDKSNAEYPLGRVMANKGLAQLIESEEREAFETYLEAISLVNKQPSSEKTFRKMLRDLEDAVIWCIQLNGAAEIKSLIKLQLN